MIKSENGNMVAKGAEISILADLTTIIRGLVATALAKTGSKPLLSSD